MRLFLLVLFSPLFIIDHYLSFLKSYRGLWGGHWERQTLGDPCHGEIWVRMKSEECYRMTGNHPGGIVRGKPYCEEKGRPAYGNAVYCKCNRELSRAPGVHGAYEDKDETVFVYSCPCGRWPRFAFGIYPVPVYIGDAQDTA